MSRRFQFSLKWLFVVMLVVAAFFGGVEFGRLEGQRYFELERAKLWIEARDLAEEWLKGKERDAKMWPTDPRHSDK
jgi:hypothetical protein